MTPRSRIGIGRALIVVGGLLLIVWAVTEIDARWFQARNARRLESLLGPSHAGLSDVARSTRREAAASGLVGRIEIERLGISAMVVEGTGGRELRRGVGHIPRTAFPGELGNVGLAGHRDSYFRALHGVELGDQIALHTPDGTFAYEVDSILVVRPSRYDLLADDGERRLTLVTCYPFYYVGPAPKRFIVRARAVEAATARVPRSGAGG
jgi:sortase A